MISGVAQAIAMKPTLRSFFSSGAFLLSHRLERADRQQRGDRGARGVRAHRLQKATPHRLVGQQRLDQRGLDAIGERHGRGGDVAAVGIVRAPAAAAQGERAIGVVGIGAVVGHRLSG